IVIELAFLYSDLLFFELFLVHPVNGSASNLFFNIVEDSCSHTIFYLGGVFFPAVVPDRFTTWPVPVHIEPIFIGRYGLDQIRYMFYFVIYNFRLYIVV
ncbi:hypothetical protein ACJX0J_006224, partial [Zea mays]